MYCAKGVPQLNDKPVKTTPTDTRAIGNTHPWILVEDWAIVESPAIIIFAAAGAKRVATVAAEILRMIEVTFIAKYFLYNGR